MKKSIIWPLGLAFALASPGSAAAADLAGLWRFDIVNAGGTTLGAMTIQTLETVEKQAGEQREWMAAKAQGAEPPRRAGPLTVPARDERVGYGGFVLTNQGAHALPIESIDVTDGKMTMVVNSPRGLVIFRGVVDAKQQRFDGKLTYHNGQVYDMHGVKQERPLAR